MSDMYNVAGQLANFLDAACVHFGAKAQDIKLDTVEDSNDKPTVVFTVEVKVSELGESRYSSLDFLLFCKEHHMNGVIFFNKNNTVTFSMVPNNKEIITV